MTELKQQFEECVSYVQNSDGNFRPSNELKLEIYGLFKQATEGDVRGKKPAMTDFIQRAKYTVWEGCMGLTSEEAIQRYIDRIAALKANNA